MQTWESRQIESHATLVKPAIGSELKSPLYSKLQELSILYSISEAFQNVTDTETILQRLVQMAREIAQAHWAVVTILDHEASGRPLKTVEDHAHMALHGARPFLDDHMLEQLVADRKPLLLPHEYPGLAIPLFIKNELLGVLKVWEKDNRLPFSEDEKLLLVMLCQKAALSLENQCLYESLYQSMLETLKALVTTLEARDPYTRAHSQRVSRYATAIAIEMGCSQEEQEIITVAGFLHDIGKVGISDAILLKPDRLIPEEYEVIKMHPVIGEQIVQHLGYFTREAVIIRHHHEWWDGRGYPDGLRRDKIPFLARIIAVADAYDALTTVRPYRSSRSSSEAIEELECWAGMQFDPRIVEAFRRTMEKNLPHGIRVRQF
jgi:putative nucleotidyltransferase with HDIG domain